MKLSDVQVNKLIAQMTLEEKANITTGLDGMSTRALERLNIPAIIMSDGPNGLRDDNSTCFPSASALASSFNVKTCEEVGKLIGLECAAKGVSLLLAPGINIKRSVLCGRNFEYYSEDPLLTGELAAAYVNGVQSTGVGSCVKHFAVNSQETRRMTNNSIIDSVTLYKIYLAAFERVVKKAKPKAIMCSYNQINGTFASDNKMLLTDILRKDWGFDGLVISDWGAVNDRVESVKAGMDFEMPAAQTGCDYILKSVQNGTLDEADLDVVVARIIKTVFELSGSIKVTPFDVYKHLQAARRLAADCVVLLKNESKILPIDSKYKKVAVIGEFAVSPRVQGSGSSKTGKVRAQTPLEELTKILGGHRVEYASGYISDSIVGDKNLIKEASELASKSDIAVVFLGLPESEESESYDRKHIEMPANQLELLSAVVRSNHETVVVLQNGSVVNTDWSDAVPALVETYFLGSAGGGAIADVLTGRVSPSGKLAETFPVKIEDTPAYTNFGDKEEAVYGEGVFVGYRHYQARKIPVRFPFGYGLSYTRFNVSNFRLDSSVFAAGCETVLRFDVENVGKVAGGEVIQIYAHRVNAAATEPDRELICFKKINLKAGECKDFEVVIDSASFRNFDRKKNKFYAAEGQFELIIGNSSLSEFARLPLTLTALKAKKEYTPNSCLGDIICDSLGEQIVNNELMGFLCMAVYGAFFTDVKLVDGKTSDQFFNNIMSNMPLRALSNFSNGGLSREAVLEILERLNA